MTTKIKCPWCARSFKSEQLAAHAQRLHGRSSAELSAQDPQPVAAVSRRRRERAVEGQGGLEWGDGEEEGLGRESGADSRPRVLVTGGRDCPDACALLWPVLDELRPSVLVAGGARLMKRIGADEAARVWGEQRSDCITLVVPAAWKSDLKFGAGPARNRWMLDECRPTIVVALPGGRGTEGMVALAEKAGVPVRRIGGGSDE